MRNIMYMYNPNVLRCLRRIQLYSAVFNINNGTAASVLVRGIGGDRIQA